MKTLLCTIIRHENQYLREYIEYNKSIGFDNICLIDNNYFGEEYPQEVIGDYIDSGYVIYKDARSAPEIQIGMYKAMYDEYKNNYDWIAFFDCDEYLTLVHHSSVNDFLAQDKFNRFNVVRINWMTIGDNGLVHNDGRGLLERFIYPTDYNIEVYDFPQNNHIKSIVRCIPDYEITFYTVHQPATYPQCNADGIEVDETECVNDYTFNDAYLRHFCTKTIEEYCYKLKRGLPDRPLHNIDPKLFIEQVFCKINELTDETKRVIKDILGVEM